MNTIKPSEDDHTLQQILREWRLTALLPPRFRERVWRRIALAEPHPTGAVWGAFRNWVETALLRPAMALGYATVLLAAGLGAGYWHGQQTTARWDATLGLRYVQAVDPYQTPRPIRQ